MLYEKVFRPIFFAMDPEWVHDQAMETMMIVSRFGLVNNLVFNFFGKTDKSIETELFGLRFPSVVGLPAGFDKAASAPLAYGAYGFGFAEMGSITRLPQPGNPKPRLWRLPQDKSLVVNYGLNSEGMEKAKEKLEKAQRAGYKKSIIGVSIARSTHINEKETIKDYFTSFKFLAPVADYVTLNVSCPNVAGYTNLQNKQFLDELLDKIQTYNQKKIRKPIFIKVGSDDLEKLIASVKVMTQYKVEAVIISNLLKGKRPKLKSAHQDKHGGISGKPLEKQANKAIAAVYQKYGKKIKIIGVGGIFTAKDAYEKIKLGASLLQMFTGFIYNGPGAVKEINQGLVELLKKDGYQNIQQAVGAKFRK